MQAMDRITTVVETGALPALAALAIGAPESKTAKSTPDADALQLEALACLR